MPLIRRLASDHSIDEFRIVAGMRFREATRLADANDRLAAIYLAGYSAEMLLKAAYFRLAGWGASQPIKFDPDMTNAKKYAKNSLKVLWPGNLHDLTGWTALLIEEHRLRGVPYPRRLGLSLQRHIQQIHVNWREFLRYRRNKPFRGEVVCVLQGVSWLLGQFRFL